MFRETPQYGSPQEFLSTEVSPYNLIILREFGRLLQPFSSVPTRGPRVATVYDIGAMIPDCHRVIKREWNFQ